MGDTSPSGASPCLRHHPWVCFAFFLMVSASEITWALELAGAQGMDGQAGTQAKPGCIPQQQLSS